LKREKKIVEATFSPFRCEVEVIGIDRRFEFKVFDKERNPIYRGTAPYPKALESKRALRDMLKIARKKIEKEGHILGPWKL